MLIFHTFWLDISKLMRIRIRFWIQLINFDSDVDPDFLFDADEDPGVDPGYQNDEDPCGSGSTKLVPIF
jgi:hypothetical protein